MSIGRPIPESRQFAEWRQIIEELGGNLVGVQSPLAFGPYAEYSVIFTRNNSTQLLSIPVSQFSMEAVREKLGKNVTSVQINPGIKKLLDEIRDGANSLIGMADQLEEEVKACLKR